MGQLTQPALVSNRSEAATQTMQRARLSRTLGILARHLLLIVFCLLFIVPFVWMVISSFKTNAQMFSVPIQWLPDQWHVENYQNALNYPGFPFLRYLANSFFYSGGVMLGTVFSCTLVGYGFARMRFPGREILFAATLATLMVPGIVTFIPTFVLFKSLNMLGTYLPLILPSFFGNAFFIFMLRQFFRNLPGELADAAKVDGAGEFRIFWQIMLPLARPAIMVMMVFSFLWTWQEFFGPLVYLSDKNQYPISLGLFAFQAQRTTDWSLTMAAATISMIPLVVIFFFTQRSFIEGIRLTGIKG